MVTLDLNPSPRVLRGFTRLWLPLFVFALGAVMRWRLDAHAAALAVWGVGTGVALAALLSRTIAKWVFNALTVATYPIAVVTSLLMLSTIFFLVVTPIGWVMRLRGHDPLRLRRPVVESYWRAVAADDDPRRATRQF